MDIEPPSLYPGSIIKCMELATLCYLKKEGKTLMIHRVKRENDMHKGKWNGLGGKIEPGETPEECVIREVKEECGLTVKNPYLKGVLAFPAFDGIEDWYVFVFAATEIEGDLHDSPEGVLKWIDDSRLQDLKVWEGDRIFMKWLNQEGIFSAKFVYERQKLIKYSVVFYR